MSEALTHEQIEWLRDLPTFRDGECNPEPFVPLDAEEIEACRNLRPFLVEGSNHNAVWSGDEREVRWHYWRTEATGRWLATIDAEEDHADDEEST